MAPAMRIGHGFDVHKIVNGRELILGGVKVDFDGKGLLGHSDADVLTHAVCDALLGAVSLGDIGAHFPDTDEKYKGISSIKLLEEVCTMVEAKGFQIENIDSTIAAQKPRLSPHINSMRKAISKAIGTDIQNVSVKATTTEGLGLTGRGEGIAVWAVVLLSGK